MDAEDVAELFQSAGAISIRRMFGGLGVYQAGDIIALVLDGEILLKGDDATAPVLEAAGSRRWTYERADGRRAKMPYWSLPEAALDDPDAMARWIALAIGAGRRAAAAKVRSAAGRRPRARDLGSIDEP